MTLTPKTAQSTRNFTNAGDGPNSSTNVGNTGKVPAFRGDGNASGGENPSPGGAKGIFYAVAEYDFAKDGALASGAIWGSGVKVPAHALVVRAGLYTETAVAGPSNLAVTLYGATAAATASADDNLVADHALSGDTQGVSVIGVPVPDTAGTWLHTGLAPREILFDFAGTTPAATTAGKVSCWVQYILLKQATPAA